MCGIFGLITYNSKHNNNNNNNNNNAFDKTKSYVLQCVNKLKHRGPDGTGIYNYNYNNKYNNNIYLAHTRLAIIDPQSGNQPFVSNDANLSLCVNGEIFNYKELREKYITHSYKYTTNSDCESILALYNYFIVNKGVGVGVGSGVGSGSGSGSGSGVGVGVCSISGSENPIMQQNYNIRLMLEQLDGQFSFILYDKINNMLFVARDPFGITQLYYGLDAEGNIYFSSEMKALESCISVNVFPSGSYMYFNLNNPYLNPINYFKHTKHGKWIGGSLSFDENDIIYYPKPIIDNNEQDRLMIEIRKSFENAVIKRLMTDVPFGILLSGGLDSSLVASVAVRYIKSHPEIYGENPKIHTFSIGDKDSTDLPFARKVAEFLGTEHHEISFTVEDGLNAIENVIYHLETYDITTIRASTPHFLLAQKIQSMGIKMVLSGEGSDELLGGYLYFHKAPSDEEHQLECKRRVLDLGYFDCLRADKSTMAHSVEGRYPFLDTEFINLCININKDVKTQNGIEKYILRKAFDIRNGDGIKPLYLPDDILWRQKEQFSDSITYRWIDTLKADTDKVVIANSSNAYKNAKMLYPINTPQTTEAFYYRQIFERLFPNRANTVKCWYPNTRWKGNTSSDPSGRAQSCHINAKL